jgi:hypothetical protein
MPLKAARWLKNHHDMFYVSMKYCRPTATWRLDADALLPPAIAEMIRLSES